MATQASDTASNTGKRSRGASGDELTVVAQRAQAFTNASGVAIALSEGNADEIVCRARSGSSAPDVGATLRTEGSFTGLCIQTGKELRCDDCETDTRVDTAAIRALNIRSMVVTPIREENRVVGVLAVFAPTPHAFTITHVAVLKTMADQISVLLQKERRAREENPQSAEPVRASAPAVTAKPVAATPAPVVPPPVVIKPAPVPVATRAATPAVSRVEPVKASLPVEVVPLAVPTRKEERREEKRPDTGSRPAFSTLDSAGDEKKSGNSRMMVLGGVAVLVIAAAGTFAFLKMQKSNASAQHPQETASAPAQPPAVAPGSQPGAPAGTVTSPTAPAAANTSAPSASTRPAESERKPSAHVAVERPVVERPVPAERPVSVATLASSGPSRINQDNSAQTAAPEVAPSFNVASNTQAPLSNLARPVASSTPSAAAIEQSQLEPIQLLRTAQLNYPAIAKARRITGVVIVEVKVGKDGKVSSPKFVSGPPVFKDAAFEAVVQYVFKPAKLNGQAIEQTTQIKLAFK